MQELIAAANVTGLLHGKVAGVRSGHDWTLLAIVSVERRGQENTVKAEYLDSLKHEMTQFSCLSSEPLFEIGDLVNKKNNQFSFLHRETLTEVTFTAGGTVSLPKRDAIPAKPEQSRARPTRIKIPPPAPEHTKHRPKPVITRADRKHFKTKGMTVEQFCATLAPLVKSFAREASRKPADVAIRLNYAGHKTACGGQWTKRLVYVLLASIFGDNGRREQSGRTADRQGKPPSGGDRGNPRQPLTSAEIARRKTALEGASRRRNP